MCQSKSVRGVSNVGKVVQGGNLAGWPVKWASRVQSLATAPPYSSYKYHGAPLVESVKIVRLAPYSAPKFILVE
jgi:hypothetical protein